MHDAAAARVDLKLSMTQNSSTSWPPPPDLHSIQELVATADVDGFIAEGAPADEYETEAEQVFAQIRSFTTDQLTSTNILPLLESTWKLSFQLSDADLAAKRPRLVALAGQIERFFGPYARPQVRGA